jgi:hypothetical protein
MIDKTSKKKMNQETADLNNTLDQREPTDLFRAFYLTATEYTFFFDKKKLFFFFFFFHF